MFFIVIAVAAVIGCVLIVVGFAQRLKQRTIRSTPALTCAQISEHSTPVICEVRGTAAPGSGEALVAPFSGRACVWHHSKVTVRYRKQETSQVTGADGTTRTETRTVTKEQVVHDVATTVPFGVRDDTGQVLVQTVGTKVDSPLPSHDEFVPAGENVDLFGLNLRVNFSNIQGHHYKEWIVPVGLPVYVLGAGSDTASGPQMSEPAHGRYIVSTRSKQELMASARTWSIGFFVAGGAVMLGVVIALIARI